MNIVIQDKVTVKDPLAKDSKSKSAWLLFTHIILWQILAILFVEGVLFFAGLGEEDIYKLDPELGTKHMTNKRVTWRSEGFSVSYFNWDGMREPGLCVEKPPGTLRIAILGDSLAEGLQVPIEVTFGKQLERMLAQKFNKPVEVLNFGTSGYSTTQEYLQLKRQVFKYKPDLVIVCYNCRDIVENWAIPTQEAVNVRPNALCLPVQNAKLIIDFSPVKRWMKTPRGRFLQSIGWMRENSRVCGILTDLDKELIQYNYFYGLFVSFLNKPGKVLVDIENNSKEELAKQTSVFLQFLSGNKQVSNVINKNIIATSSATTEQPVQATSIKQLSNKETIPTGEKPANTTEVGKDLSTGHLLEKTSVVLNKTEKQNQRQPYELVLERTLGSLLEEMSKECKNHGANFAVVAMPVRSALCEDHSKDKVKDEFDYSKEIEMLKEITDEKHLAFFDCCAEAVGLSLDARMELFYFVHLTPKGHEFVANKIINFVKPQLPQVPPALATRTTAGLPDSATGTVAASASYSKDR